MGCSRKRIFQAGNSSCKGSEVGISLECCRHSQEAHVCVGRRLRRR